MRLPVIESCLRCLYCDAERGLCCHPGVDRRYVMRDDGPPPEWCPRRTGPDADRLAALERVAEAAREVQRVTAALPMSASEIIGAEHWDALDVALAELDKIGGGT